VLSSFNGNIPAVPFPEDFEPGRWTASWQIQGKTAVLSKGEAVFFYTGANTVSLGNIATYLPNSPPDPNFVPAGTKVMLEGGLEGSANYTGSMEPYAVWYAGRNLIGEGAFSGGVHRFIWEVPDRSSFQGIRLVLYPFLPEKGDTENVAGIVKELSMPVNTKAVLKGYFDERASSLDGWYQFEGNLNDSIKPNIPETLVSLKNAGPRWVPGARFYGLAVDFSDSFSVPKDFLARVKQSGKAGSIYLRFVPVNPGHILQMQLDADMVTAAGTESANYTVELSWTADGLILRMTGGPLPQSVTLPFANYEEEGCFTAVLSVTLTDGITVGMHLENKGGRSNGVNLYEDCNATGDGSITLGGGKLEAAGEVVLVEMATDADPLPLITNSSGAPAKGAEGTSGEASLL
jgi:hypothetical protein